jgi:hypothetical protein
MKKLLWLGFALWVLAAVAQAQDTPKADVAVEYSPLYILKGYTIWNNGGGGSVAVNANDWFGVAGDFGAYLGHVPESLVGETYLFGPRFSYRKLQRRVVPFAQALFGGSHFSQSTGGITGGGTQFTFAIGGGADLVSSRGRFALRLEGDYFGIRSSGSTTPAMRLGIGIVYRIGRR